MPTNGLLSNFKDICLSGAAITTAIVAWRGLASWQKELKGKADFEVARNLEKCVSESPGGTTLSVGCSLLPPLPLWVPIPILLRC